jgi:glycosyltransferase involved in cell wall biosynthesis
MNELDVSVVIPAYNAEGFIAEALGGIAAQQALPREVIVVDDGSTDGTAQAVSNWVSTNASGLEVRLVRQANGGISSARNQGIRQANGEWIAFLDADDIWEPDHLQQLFAALNHAPGAVAAYGAGRLFIGDKIQELPYDEFWDNPSKQFGSAIERTSFFALGRSAFPRLIRGNFIKPSSLMVRASAIGSVGPFDESLGNAEDREFLARLLLAGSFVYCSIPITRYRWHDNNASQAKNAMRNMEWGLIAIESIRRRQARHLSSEEAQACCQAIAEGARSYLSTCSRSGTARYASGLRFIGAALGVRVAFSALALRHLIASLYWSLGGSEGARS